MNQLDRHQFGAIAELIGDTPFTVTPYFFLKRGTCEVYADDPQRPRYGAIIPHTPRPDVYVFGATGLATPDIERLADFVAGVGAAAGHLVPAGYLVPADLVQPIRARRRIDSDVEGLCFTYRRAPRHLSVWRPELVRQLGLPDARWVEALPGEAAFLYHNYGSPAELLADGLAFGVFQEQHLVSLSTSLAITPNYNDIGVYTRPRFRSLGYATDCVETILTQTLALGKRPLWRVGIRQKIAIYFAEKLKMEEIGTNGQEIYLQAGPS